MNFFDKNHLMFDMDGTLLDSMVCWSYSGKAYAEKLNIDIPDDVAESFARMSLQRARDTMQKYTDKPLSIDMFSDVLLELYMNHAKVKNGVIQYLEEARLLGKKMCVITATPRRAAIPCLNHFGLLKYFDFILTADECFSGKDEPLVFNQALKLFDCEKNDAVMFEDALYSIKTSTQMRILTVAVAEGYYSFCKDDIKKYADVYLENGFLDLLNSKG